MKCSNCNQTGHNKRTCPVSSSTRSGIGRSTKQRKSIHTSATSSTSQHRSASSINFESCIYCVFDLETTGLSKLRHNIIEISSILLDSNGILIEDGTFNELVKPPMPIPSLITGLTGISDDMV